MSTTRADMSRKIYRAVWNARSSGSKILLPNFTPTGWWECDIFRAMESGTWEEWEVKTTLSDFRADKKKATRPRAWRGDPGKNKHAEIAAGNGPNRFWFCVPESIGDKVEAELPDWAGLVTVETDQGTGVYMRTVRKAKSLGGDPYDPKWIERGLIAINYRYWRKYVTT